MQTSRHVVITLLVLAALTLAAAVFSLALPGAVKINNQNVFTTGAVAGFVVIFSVMIRAFLHVYRELKSPPNSK